MLLAVSGIGKNLPCLESNLPSQASVGHRYSFHTFRKASDPTTADQTSNHRFLCSMKFSRYLIVLTTDYFRTPSFFMSSRKQPLTNQSQSFAPLPNPVSESPHASDS